MEALYIGATKNLLLERIHSKVIGPATTDLRLLLTGGRLFSFLKNRARRSLKEVRIMLRLRAYQNRNYPNSGVVPNSRCSMEL